MCFEGIQWEILLIDCPVELGLWLPSWGAGEDAVLLCGVVVLYDVVNAVKSNAKYDIKSTALVYFD